MLVAPEGMAATVTGKQADLIEAAKTAFNVALRLIKPGACLCVAVVVSCVQRAACVLCGKQRGVARQAAKQNQTC